MQGACRPTSNSDTVTITGNEFTGNTVDSSGYSGGGAYITSSTGTINFTGNIFKNNSASSPVQGTAGGSTLFQTAP